MKNYQKSLLSLLSLLIVFLGLPTLVAAAPLCTPFTRNLALGAQGEDVVRLQQFLNTNALTRVSDTGPGSLGQETAYFGAKTKLAVIKFQDLYRVEVLTPAGLTHGTGFVGAFSRAKLFAMCSSQTTASPSMGAISPTPSPVAPTPTPATPPEVNTLNMNAFLVGDDSFHVKYPSQYVAHPGDKITIYGGGFTAGNNTLRIGTLSISGLTPNSSGLLELVIPENAPLGKSDLWVENSKGISNKSFIIVTLSGTLPPSIASLSTTTAKIGDIITVNGSGFTATNNELFLNVMGVKGVSSSDGKTMTFTFDPKVIGMTPDLIPAGMIMGINETISLFVVNGNGISNRVTFLVKY